MSSPFSRLKLKLAWQCLREGDLPSARIEAEEGLEAEGRSVQLQGLLAEISRRQGNRSDAESLAQEVLEQYGPDHLAASVLGRLRLESGKYDRAISYLKESYRLRPNSFYAELIIDCLEKQNKTEEAEKFLNEALQKFPEDPRCLKRAARFYDRSNRISESIQTVEKLLKVDPENDWAKRMKIELKANGSSPESIAKLLKIGNRDKDPSMHGLYAKKLKASGKFTEAGEEFARAAELASDNNFWGKQAGFAYARARDNDKAIEFLKPLFLNEPQDQYIRNALFAAVKRRDGKEEVVKLIDEALARHPDKGFLFGLRTRAKK